MKRLQRGSYWLLLACWFSPLLADSTDPAHFANLLTTLPKAQHPEAIPQAPLILLHQSLLQNVRHTPAGLLPPPEGAVHKDYQHFFHKIIPAFANFPPSPLPDPHLLAYFGKDQPHGAELIFTGQPHTLPKQGHQLEITAAYTSEFQYPVGFFAAQGVVINPALQPWEGLVLLTANGQMDIRHLEDVSLTGKTLTLTSHQSDYRQFIHLVETKKMSVFQSHLLIGMGRNLVKQLENQPKVRRRVLFRDRSGGVGVYDSQEESMTLYEVAEILLKNYQPFHAVNLDMGSYNYCVTFQDGIPVRQCGIPKATAHLSNLLRLTIKQ